MKPHRRVFVVGGAHSTFIGKGHPDFIHRRHPDFGTRENPSAEAHLATALGDAFAETGVEPTEIDKIYVSNFLGECFLKQGHMGALLAAVEPRLDGKPIARIEAACASGAAAIAACIDAMQAGCDVTLAAGVEIETNVRGADGIEYMALAAHYAKQRSMDTHLFPHFFARRAKHYKAEHGATNEDIGRVVAKAYANANRNPKAHMRALSMTAQEAATVSAHNYVFLDDKALRPHIKLADCTHFTDGASAVLLASEEGLRRLGIAPGDCTEILSYGHTVAPLGAETNPLFLDNMNRAAKVAYSDAGVRPSEVEIAEVHDCFSINELQMYEALELCGRGEAAGLLARGETAVEGRLPVNTGGGLIGFGHPIGATGVKQAVEIWRQMKGKCGDYQVPGRPELAVTANLGGDDRTGIVMVHKNLD